MKHSKLLILLSLFVLFTPCAAKAGQDLVSFGTGWYDINDNKGAADFRLEYRRADPFFWVVKPWVGAEASSDGAAYGVGGLLFDFQIEDKWLITPSFGAGLYADGGGKDLGHTVEFRSQLELGYKFKSGSRVGIAGGHISNASLADRNPGTEILSLYYHVPANALFGD